MGRMAKVNQLMKREISTILQREVQDPRVEFVSITGVTVSPDLHVARVNFSVLGDEKKKEEATKALDSARGYIRRLIGKRISLRYTPDLEFIYDNSLEYSARMEQTLEEIKKQAPLNEKGEETGE
jgi:ribosome-binding factor A